MDNEKLAHSTKRDHDRCKADGNVADQPTDATEESALGDHAGDLIEARYTKWRSVVDTTSGQAITTTWGEFFETLEVAPPPFAGKKAHPGWSAAVFDPLRRLNVNVRELTALVLDYEGGTSIGDACGLWRESYGFLHTSKAHTDEAPRFRVILPFTRAVTSEEYSRLWRWAKERVKAAGQHIDPSPKDAARFWYLPSRSIGRYEARWLLGDVLDPDAIPETETEADADATSTGDFGLAVGERNQALFRLAASLRSRGAERDEILAAVSAANRESCDEPLDDEEVRRIATSATRYPRGGGPMRLTEKWNGERIAQKFGDALRYVQRWKTWLCWDERRWARDQVGAEMMMAKKNVELLDSEAKASLAAAAGDEAATMMAEKLAAFAKASAKANAIRAALLLAQSETPIAATSEAFDRDAWLLNVANGTVDLRTGKLGPHRREDLITMLAPVAFDPAARAPVFERFLERVLPDVEMRTYVQRLLGSTLTGDVGDEAIFFLYGTGRNGKSKLLGSVQYVLGDYALQASPVLLLATERGGDDAGKRARAALRGKRLVLVQEVDSDRYLNEAQLKQITGGDKITGARLYEDEGEFAPTHKVIVATNYKPKVRGQDEGIWSRLRLVPFTVTIPEAERDRNLTAKLEREASGILTWLVQGCLEWQRKGLAEPAAVREATATYRADEDDLGEFLEAYTEATVDAFVSSGELHAALVSHSGDFERVMSKKALVEALAERGFPGARRTVNGTTVRGILGLRLRPAGGRR